MKTCIYIWYVPGSSFSSVVRPSCIMLLSLFMDMMGIPLVWSADDFLCKKLVAMLGSQVLDRTMAALYCGVDRSNSFTLFQQRVPSLFHQSVPASDECSIVETLFVRFEV